MIQRLALASVFLLLVVHGRAAAYEIPWQEIRNQAAEYLDKCIDTKEVAKRHKRFRSSVEQRMSDSDSASEDNVMRSIMLDWAAGNGKRLKNKDRDAVIQACYYFVVFYDKGYDIPEVIRAALTEKNVSEILAHLSAEIEKVKK